MRLPLNQWCSNSVFSGFTLCKITEDPKQLLLLWEIDVYIRARMCVCLYTLIQVKTEMFKYLLVQFKQMLY